MDKPILYYLKNRGRAELLRVILAEAGVEYVEHPVATGSPPIDGRPTDFQQLKDSGILPFNALPVWEEPDGWRVAQLLAIAGYLGEKYNLSGSSLREAAQCNSVLGGFEDVRAELRKLQLAPEAARAAVRKEMGATVLPKWMGYFDRILTANKVDDFMVGNRLTIADLAVWYLIEMLVGNGFEAPVAKYPRLVNLARKVLERPRIAAWTKSAKRYPFAPLPA